MGFIKPKLLLNRKLSTTNPCRQFSIGLISRRGGGKYRQIPMKIKDGITVTLTINCNDVKCQRVNNFWGEYTEYAQIDLEEFKTASEHSLIRQGWFLTAVIKTVLVNNEDLIPKKYGSNHA